MLKRHILLIAVGATVGCAAGPKAKPVPPAPSNISPKAPAKPTDAAVTPKIAAIALPPGWSQKREDGRTIFRGPDPTLSVTVVVAQGSDLNSAIESGWKRVDAANIPTAKEWLPLPSAPRAFEKTLVAKYEIDAQQVYRQAISHLAKGHSFTILLQGPLVELKKRSAQVREIMGAVKPADWKPLELTKDDAISLGEEHLNKIRSFVDQGREKLEVPGVAIAIVQNGKVVLKHATGFADLKKQTPLTTQTHMMVGSITKSFTGLLLAKLVSEGKVQWNTPVTDLHPQFRLKSPEQTAKLQLQHLMCACTGVPRKDMPLLFEWEKATPESALRDMAQIELLTKFGETFQYSNQMVAAAGFVLAKSQTKTKTYKLSTGYRKLLRQKVLAPLGMTDSFLDFDRVLKLRRFATPHSETLLGSIQAVNIQNERFVSPYAPAGALWSTAEDFAKLLVALTSPSYPGLPPKAELEYLWQPQVKVAAHASYGLGWLSTKYRGAILHTHGGGTLGFRSYFAYVPAAQTGYVFLTNGSRGGALRHVMEQKILETLFGQKEESKKTLAFIRKRIDKNQADQAKLISETVPPARQKALIGRYQHPELGRVDIRKRGKQTIFDTGPLEMAFVPYKSKLKREEYVIMSPPLAGIRFWVTEEKGGQPAIHLEPNNVRYTLRRVKPKTSR